MSSYVSDFVSASLQVTNHVGVDHMFTTEGCIDDEVSIVRHDRTSLEPGVSLDCDNLRKLANLS